MVDRRFPRAGRRPRHGTPSGTDPCDETDALSLVYDAATLDVDDVACRRLGVERLGTPYELDQHAE